MIRIATIPAFAGAGLLLAGVLTAGAQTAPPSGSCGSASSDALQPDMLCGNNSGSAATDSGSADAAGGSGGSAVAPQVENDPLGMATRPSITPGPGDLIDNQATSAIPEARRPKGMAPLIVPNDPLGTATRQQVPSPTSRSINGNPGISSPSIQ
jgi:hypothetical protein